MFASPPNLFRVKPFMIAATILLALAIAFAGRAFIVSRQDSEAQPRTQANAAPRVIVQTAPASVGAISSVYGYAGQVQAAQQVSVVPRTSGIVKDILVDVGQTVRQGEVIATLDPGALPQQVEQARTNLFSTNVKLQQERAGARPEVIATAHGYG